MAHKSTAAFNECFEDINLAEQRRHRQMGFTRGYSVGEEAGWRDGYIFGLRKGAQLSAEIGYYQGFAHAWISILEHEDCNKQRKLNALHSLLEMTRNFPKTNNLLEDDTIQKLARIRAKFKQVNALILGSSSSGSIGGIIIGGGGGGGGGGTSHHHHPHHPHPPPQASATVGASGVAAAATAAAAATSGATMAAGQHPHPHPPHPPHPQMFHRSATSCTSQESGFGTSSFRGISPSSNNNLQQQQQQQQQSSATTTCLYHNHPHPHHHHHHHHLHHQIHQTSVPPPPNVEMSF